MHAHVQEQDQLAVELEQRGQAEWAGFLNDLTADPPQAQIAKSMKHDRALDYIDDQWVQFREGCELQAAGGTVTGRRDRVEADTRPNPRLHRERLRSERLERSEPSPEKAHRARRLLKVLQRAETAYALGEEPREDDVKEFREILLEK